MIGGEATQTGGMCAALEILLDSGHTVLGIDAEGSLLWEREEHAGWGVGLYPPKGEYIGECLTFGSTEDGSVSALPALVDDVLAAFRGAADAAVAVRCAGAGIAWAVLDLVEK